MLIRHFIYNVLYFYILSSNSYSFEQRIGFCVYKLFLFLTDNYYRRLQNVCKKGPSTWMLVWLQHEKDCFDNPTTYLPYIEGKADSKLCCKHSAISYTPHKAKHFRLVVELYKLMAQPFPKATYKGYYYLTTVITGSMWQFKRELLINTNYDSIYR